MYLRVCAHLEAHVGAKPEFARLKIWCCPLMRIRSAELQHGGLEGGRPKAGTGIKVHFKKHNGEDICTVEANEGDDLVDIAQVGLVQGLYGVTYSLGTGVRPGHRSGVRKELGLLDLSCHYGPENLRPA
jgi:hypothetical protein